MKRSRIDVCLISLLLICLLFENIKLFSVFGGSVKPSHLIVLTSILYCLFNNKISKNKISKKSAMLILLFVALPVFPLYRILNMREWFKSYVIYILIICFFVFCYSHFKSIYAQKFMLLQKIVCWVFFIGELLGIIQFIAVNFFGVKFLIDAFGPFQFHFSYYNYEFGFMRCFSVFHEPSVLGWVSSSFIFILIYWKNNGLLKITTFWFYLLISLISIACSLSASALYFVFLAFFIDFILHIRSAKSWLLLFCFILLSLLLSTTTSVLTPMLRLFTESGVEGTSGFERINSPLEYAIKTINEYPFFGRGIGQDEALDNVGHIPGTITSTANNSFFEIVQNFGLSSLLFFVFLLYKGYKSVRKDKNRLFLLVSVFCVFLCTGAYLSMDFLIVAFATLVNVSVCGHYTASTRKSCYYGNTWKNQKI